MPQFIKLGSFDLSNHIASEIKPSGGSWKAKQDGGVSLTTGAIKDVPSGLSYAFKVVFDNDKDASDFLAYCFPYSPDSPDFDEGAGADLDLYIRNSDWHFKVWSVMVVPTTQNNTPTDHTLFFYDVYCYLYSPYSEGTMQTWTEFMIGQEMSKVATSPSGTVYGLDPSHVLWTFARPDGWTQFATQSPVALIDISANDTYIMGLTAAGTVYQYASGAWTLTFGGLTGIIDVSIAEDGTIFVIKSDNHLYVWSGSAFSSCGGSNSLKCAAVSSSQCWVIYSSDNKAYRFRDFSPWYIDGPKGANTLADIACSSVITNICAVSVAADAKKWNEGSASWNSLAKSVICSSCSSGGVSWWLDENGYVWEFDSDWLPSGQIGETVQTIDNTKGHLKGSPSIVMTCAYESTHVEDVTVSIGSDVLTITYHANSDEVWTLNGNEKRISEVYEDDITSITKWDLDWVVGIDDPPQYLDGKIIIDSGITGYILLSGPNKILSPIVMTADLSLDSGGATGKAYVQMSSDATNWITVFDEAAFQDGVAPYGIPAMGMTDVYVRLYNNAGTATHYLRLGSIKFEVERAADPCPKIAAGLRENVTINSTGGSLTLFGSFAPRRILV